MRRLIFILAILPIIALRLYATGNGNTLVELNRAIAGKAHNDAKKERRINEIKERIQANTPLLQRYQLNEMLYDEYRKFKTDSAILYVKRNMELAAAMKSKELSEASQLKLSFLYSSSGKYRESESILKCFHPESLSEHTLPMYYEAYCSLFNSYSSNVLSGDYRAIVETYRDSLLNVLPIGTRKYILTQAEKDLYQGNSGNAEKSLLMLLTDSVGSAPDYALITYLLGMIYEKRNDREAAIEYFSRSAIRDIHNSVKDNASMNFLASIFYSKGDLGKAYICAQSAIEDAVFCNVQFRTVSMSELYTIINVAYQTQEARSKAQWQMYLLLISILSLFLLLMLLYIYRQMKKVSAIRRELSASNNKLSAMNVEVTEINQQLNRKNSLLSESNYIKEEYIAHFFDLCSTYIKKLENYRKSLNKLANEKRLDELYRTLKSTTVIENELEELYRNFDSIFINLYPTFVEDFNALLTEEEQVVLKPGQILNSELRIFALMRLGITDNMKIAAFLRFSLSTIYNYRTRVRNNTVVARDEFDKTVMNIGSYRNQ